MKTLFVRERSCSSLLNSSGISDYCVNCYTGCLHGCRYCYARYMSRYNGHQEPWGTYLDIKVNAPQVLARQLRKAKAGANVIMSSVCDGWQPVEADYGLSRACLILLLEAGLSVQILTKGELVGRDLDVMNGAPASLGMTVTTLDQTICAALEPGASPSHARLKVLERAAELDIPVWVFFGPIIPGLNDSDRDLRAMFRQLASLPLTEILIDRLNARSGVWKALEPLLKELSPGAANLTRRILFSAVDRAGYSDHLARRVRQAAAESSLEDRLTLCW